jgi:hydrogenase/urease accessory protein HupE
MNLLTRIKTLAIFAAIASGLFSVGAAPTHAHDVRPAYLQIEPLSPDRYTLIWRTPVLSGAPLPVVLDLPSKTVPLSEARRQNMPGTTVERLAVEFPGGLEGERIGFIGLEATITDVLVRLKLPDGTTTTTLVRPSQPWIDIKGQQGALQMAGAFVQQGMEHILFGFDHLLFVAALMLIVRNWLVLVKTVTAFTVAHSITLTCATLGWMVPPSGPVEILIAFSIVLIACEIVAKERGQSNLALRSPWIVAFAFGLLHGFGFAGALQDLGLPQGDIPLALLSFNLGVEAGQLLFVGVLLLVYFGLKQLIQIPRRAVLVSAYLIGSVAAFWTAERLFSAFA